MPLNTDLPGALDPDLLLERLRDAQDTLLRAYAHLELALEDGAAPEDLMRSALEAQACQLLAGDAVSDVMALAHQLQLVLNQRTAGNRPSLFLREHH